MDCEQGTLDLARRVGLSLKGGEVICLSGELGAGKTVFAKGVASALGVKQTVTSPTFNIIKQYQGNSLALCHIDLYRVDSEEAQQLGIQELYEADTVVLIEWASNAPEIVPEHAANVSIVKRGETSRQICIEGLDGF